MLEIGTRASFVCLGSYGLNLPPGLSHSAIFMILATVGAIAGLYFFFHGFSLLQQVRLTAPRIVSHKLSRPTTVVTAAPTTDASELLQPESRPEVIQLTPAENAPATSTSMSQQGKIAAALLRAGIGNPVIMAEIRSPSGAQAGDTTVSEKESTHETDASRVLHKTAGASSIPALNAMTAAPNTSQWKANLMIWGGPVLTLACIYFLAAHLGWL
jgi:hypothetical protein